ncbi:MULTISPECIES: DUF6894 family protein [Sphingomonas]|uniref:DUF6894 family protein n=1 Tax=Sphingomonas TaxID=13687 RepID=UPI001269A062|nr:MULTISPECIES: hypothetical protein [Sphingomonas]
MPESLVVPRFFFHLVDDIDALLDRDGQEVAAHDIPQTALKAARDCMAGDVQEGRLDLGYSIEVHDEAGHLIHSQPFGDSVEIVRQDAPAQPPLRPRSP